MGYIHCRGRISFGTCPEASLNFSKEIGLCCLALSKDLESNQTYSLGFFRDWEENISRIEVLNMYLIKLGIITVGIWY